MRALKWAPALSLLLAFSSVAHAQSTITVGSTKYTLCANEYQTCKFSGAGSVVFGVVPPNAPKAMLSSPRTFNNSVPCYVGPVSNNDPAYGYEKSCWVAITPPANSGSSSTTPSKPSTPVTPPVTPPVVKPPVVTPPVTPPVTTPPVVTPPVSTPTGTSVSSLTTPDVSDSNFAGSSNGNLATADVSTVNIHTLLYAGHTTKVLAHYTPWWDGYTHGVDTGYNSDNPLQIAATLSSMNTRGVDGIILDWYGQTNNINKVWLDTLPYLAKYPNMSFSIMIDEGIQRVAPCSGCSATQTVMQAMQYIAATYFTNPQYTKINGKYLMTEFALDEVWGTLDWAQIQAAYPNVVWVHQHAPEGYAKVASGGGYSWVDAPNRTSPLPTVADLTRQNQFNQYGASHLPLIPIAAVMKGFDDTKASWANPNHYEPQNCGNTWLQTFASINQYFSTAKQLPFVQLVTWNDYEEGSALEPGIATCSTVGATTAKLNINVAVTHPETVDHFELYQQTASSTFVLIGSYPTTTTTIAVKGTGSFFVKAVGKPFIQNVVSSVVNVTGK